MRDIHKMCRICLGQGSREIFEQSLGSHLLARDDRDLARIAEKLRFVTMLKVNPKENLPQQICDLCIVQLNVSYNFKRLALKNDFQIRQYMIENGMSLNRDDDDNSMETTTALEIHQIQHNVIRTNRFRQIAVPEIRRNSTTSSVSGASTMLIHGKDNEANSATNTFLHPRPIVRPIQIKEEPVDPDDEQQKEPNPVTSSPSNASEPSIITVSSNTSSAKPSTPMVQINGIVNNESYEKKQKSFDSSSAPAPLSVKLGRSRFKNNETESENTKRNLRKTTKSTDVRKSKRKVQTVLKAIGKGGSKRKQEMDKLTKMNKPTSKKKERSDPPRPRGRPRKEPGAPKLVYKTKAKALKS